jgi:hypothetical protein
LGPTNGHGGGMLSTIFNTSRIAAKTLDSSRVLSLQNSRFSCSDVDRFYPLAANFVMLEAAYRKWHMLVEGARPIDWAILIVDFLVLAVILWLDAPERLHKRTIRKGLRVVQLCLVQGQELRNSVPSSGQDSVQVNAWTKSVEDWIRDTQMEMSKRSTQAGISFAHFSGGASSLVNYTGIAGTAMQWYKELLLRLDNLRNIMEKADVYF